MNPAEMLRQSRDSQRISDFSTLKSALSLYLLDSSNPQPRFVNRRLWRLLSYRRSAESAPQRQNAAFSRYRRYGVSTTQTLYRKKDSTGWLPVNFSQITLGAPLSSLPVDPINNANYYYAYAATSTNGVYYFEIDNYMESKKYGPADPMMSRRTTAATIPRFTKWEASRD